MIFINSENNKKYLLFLTIVIKCRLFDAIYQSASGINFLGFENNIERRLTGVFGDEEVWVPF